MRETFPFSGERRCEHSDDTRMLGEKLGAALEAGDVVILDGPLGAGKTTFTQGIAQGLGVMGRVSSPTFTIAREHEPGPGAPEGAPGLIHVDAYRLLGEDPGAQTDPLAELDSLDLDSDLDHAVVVAEWGSGLIEQIAQSYLLVTFDRTTAVENDPDSEARLISWEWRGGTIS